LSFYPRGDAPTKLRENLSALKELVGRPCRASEAHRLPKSVAYVSAGLAQVKAKGLENRGFSLIRSRGLKPFRAKRDDDPLVGLQRQ
jgi:hypothetical protein